LHTHIYCAILWVRTEILCKGVIFTEQKRRYVGAAILAYIKEKGLKQSRIADKANLRKSAFNEMLHGKRAITAETYFSICTAMDLPLSQFEEERRKEGAA
jgi:transcriptional regulator with XRE-family HTH domain